MSLRSGLWRMNGKPLGNTPVTPWRIMPAGPHSSGPTLPASPQLGQVFLHTPGYPTPTRKLFLVWDGVQWNTLFGFGTTNLYVDTTNGNDVQGNGYATGTAAYKTAQFATNQLLGAQLFGNGTVNIAAGTYAETVTVQGVAFGGNYALTYKGARAADTLGDTTNCTWANGAGNGVAGFSTITLPAATLTAHALQNKWLETTSGTGGSPKQIFLVHDNTTQVITVEGNISGTGGLGGTLGDTTTHFHVYGYSTIIDGQSTRGFCVNVQGVPGVVLNELTLQGSTVANANCANVGKLNLLNCLVQNGGLINVQYENGALADSIIGCAILNDAFAGLFMIGSQVNVISGCRIVGSTASATGIICQINSTIGGNITNSYVSESGGGSIGANIDTNAVMLVSDYTEFGACGSHGVNNTAGGRTKAVGFNNATIRFLNNGGWGVLSQGGGQGEAVSTCTYSGNTSGTFSPNTDLVGGNS